MQLRKHRRWNVKCRNWNVNVRLEDLFAWRRNKNDPTGIVLSNNILISLAMWKFTCLPVTEVILPVWPGYWQDLSARQNLPSRCLCIVQIVFLATCSSDKPRIPALTKMSSFSLTLLHLDKWKLAKCNAISSTHSDTNTFPSTPLLGPHSISTISRKNNLMKQPNKPFCSIDLIYGDFSDMIIFETGTCCILIQLDWNSIKQNKTIVGIRMLYPNKN